MSAYNYCLSEKRLLFYQSGVGVATRSFLALKNATIRYRAFSSNSNFTCGKIGQTGKKASALIKLKG